MTQICGFTTTRLNHCYDFKITPWNITQILIIKATDIVLVINEWKLNKLFPTLMMLSVYHYVADCSTPTLDAQSTLLSLMLPMKCHKYSWEQCKFVSWLIARCSIYGNRFRLSPSHWFICTCLNNTLNEFAIFQNQSQSQSHCYSQSRIMANGKSLCLSVSNELQ